MLFTHLYLYRSVALRLLFLSLPVSIAQAQGSDASFSSGGAAIKDTVTITTLNQQATKLVAINLDSALTVAGRALHLSEQIQFRPGQANALMTLTVIYQNKGAYAKATSSALAAIELYERLHDVAAMGAAYYSLAMVYKDMSGNDRTTEYSNTAIGYSTQSYQLYRSIADTAGIVNSLSLRGTLYRDKAIRQNDNRFYDTAFDAFINAIRLVKSSGKGSQYISKLYNNISQVYTEQKKDYHMALTYLFEAVAINEKNNNTISLSYNYGNISETYLKLNKPEQGLIYAKKMLNAARQTARPNRLVNGLLQMFRAYESAGRADSALAYYKEAVAIDDSLNGVAVTHKVDELKTQYETEKKEISIRLLNAENGVKNTRITWLAIGLFIFGALAIWLITLYRRVQHQKAQLSAQATRLEVMMKELHHRVKNNLQIVSSLLNMQTYRLQDAESISALKTSGERVQAMSLIHQRLYNQDELTAVNLKEYITDLAESLMQSYGYNHHNFELYIVVEQELMDVDTAIPIGLIVNELITNSLKYAYRTVAHPSLEVSLTGQGSSIRLSVKDNGQDFSIAQWQQGKGSFGKQLIVSLCRQLRARQTVDTSNGTEFVITIPLKAA